MSHQEPNQPLSWLFVELWIDTGLNPPYVLQLIQQQDGQYHIIDPQENSNVLYTTASYDDARFWLSEDEYQFVGERIENINRDDLHSTTQS